MSTWKTMALFIVALVGAIAVAGVNGYASWGHIVHIGVMVGEPSAALLPFAVDGMMLVGTALCGVDRLRGYQSRGFALACLWAGSIMTLAFNAGSAWARGFCAVVIACTYAVALLLTVEAIFRGARKAIVKIEADTPAEPAQPAETVSEAVEAVTVPQPRKRARKAASVDPGAQDGAPRPRRPRAPRRSPMTTARGPELVLREAPVEVESTP
jgi:hypothetical protein